MIVNHTVVGLNLAIWQDESIIRVRMSVILKKILTIMSAKQFIIRHSTFTLHTRSCRFDPCTRHVWSPQIRPRTPKRQGAGVSVTPSCAACWSRVATSLLSPATMGTACACGIPPVALEKFGRCRWTESLKSTQSLSLALPHGNGVFFRPLLSPALYATPPIMTIPTPAATPITATANPLTEDSPSSSASSLSPSRIAVSNASTPMYMTSTTPSSLCAPESGHALYLDEHIATLQ